jgi:hypothetical protein
MSSRGRTRIKNDFQSLSVGFVVNFASLSFMICCHSLLREKYVKRRREGRELLELSCFLWNLRDCVVWCCKQGVGVPRVSRRPRSCFPPTIAFAVEDFENPRGRQDIYTVQERGRSEALAA